MSQEWYYEKSGKQVGPISSSELKAKARAGELLPSDLIWREGMTDWKPARSAKGLFQEVLPAASVIIETSAGNSSGINEKRVETDPVPNIATEPTITASQNFSFKKTAIAAAKLGAAQAERAKIANVSLPQQYMALGQECLTASVVQAEFNEQISKLDEIQSEINCLKDHEAGKTNSISEKARAAADYAVRSAKKAKLSFEHSSLLSALGRAVYKKHGCSGYPENLTAPIQTSLSRIASLDDKIATLSQSSNNNWLTPHRFLIVALVLLAFGGHWGWQMMMSPNNPASIQTSLPRQASQDSQTATFPQSSNNNWLTPSRILITAVLLLVLGGLWRWRMKMSQSNTTPTQNSLSGIESRDSQTATLSKSSNNSWLTPSRILITAVLLSTLGGLWGWRTTISHRNKAIVATVEAPAPAPAPSKEKPDRLEQDNEENNSEIIITSGGDIATLAATKFPPHYFEKGPNGEKLEPERFIAEPSPSYVDSSGVKIPHGLSKHSLMKSSDVLNGGISMFEHSLYDKGKFMASIQVTEADKPIEAIVRNNGEEFSEDLYYYNQNDVIHLRADYRIEGNRRIPLFNPFRVDNPPFEKVRGRSISIQVSSEGLAKKVVQIDRFFNPSIKNQKCGIENNHLYVEFDIDISKWCELGQHPLQFGLLFRIFDENRNYITHFHTQERFCATLNALIMHGEKFLKQQQVLKRIRMSEDKIFAFPTFLFPSNNVLVYPISEEAAQNAAIVHLSFYVAEFN